jgi:protein-disulfide isomerase
MLDDVTMNASMLTKRMGMTDRILVEFSDFQCPYCANYALDELPRIKRELVDTGIVSYGFLHFPLKGIHPEAAAAAAAAECAGQQGRLGHARQALRQSRAPHARRVPESLA